MWPARTGSRVLWIFVSAFGLGLAFCAPPGAVTAEAIRRGLARGFRPAFLVEVGSLLGDATWAGIALTGAAILVQNGPARVILGVVGSLLLFRLGWSAIQAARVGTSIDTTPVRGRGDLVAGAALSLTNPLSIAFWVGVGGGAVQSIVPQPVPRDFLVFYVGFMIACVFWCFLMSAIIAYARSVLNPTVFRVVNATCGVTLIAFGGQLLRGVLLAA